MPYLKSHVIEQSGLPDRTIRNYIGRGLLPPPEGYGMAATYSEEHMVRAVAIGRMRAQGDHVDTITARVDGWSLARFRRFVTETHPEPPPPPVAAPLPSSEPSPALPQAPAQQGEPVNPGQARLESHDAIDDLALPEGPSFRILPLLPGLGLMLDSEAAPIVRRIAAEICHRYGRR
jgi:DNA-binding transcriptional MerR regulator